MRFVTRRNVFMLIFLIVVTRVAIDASNSGAGEEIQENDFEYQKKELTDYQEYITQKGGTEKPFENEFWNNKKAGIYVDVVSGEPLFSSLDKFDSGTGWPSFTKPLEDENIIEKNDMSIGIPRTEVKSAKANSHLGHVFDDGPNGGDRYCINSASLKFIPVEELEKEGYGGYAGLF